MINLDVGKTLSEHNIHSGGVIGFFVKQFNPNEKEGIFYIKAENVQGINKIMASYSWTLGRLRDEIISGLPGDAAKYKRYNIHALGKVLR